MHRRVIEGTLFVCGIVGALDIGYHLGRGALLPSAVGQAAEADVILVAANTQNEAVCFVYNKKTNHLNSYLQRSTGGLDLKGIRKLDSDFTQQIDEYPKSQGETAVSNMKELAEQIEKEKAKRKSRFPMLVPAAISYSCYLGGQGTRAYCGSSRTTRMPMEYVAASERDCGEGANRQPDDRARPSTPFQEPPLTTRCVPSDAPCGSVTSPLG